MFLNILNEKEGKNFLELAKIAMMVNGEIKESEQDVFNTYRRELALFDYELKNTDYNALVTSFKSSTKRVKKAVIIELAGVLDADEEIDQNENDWIKKLGEDLGFREFEISKMVRWTQDFNDLLGEAVSYINKR